MDLALDELTQKLDLLTMQVAYLTEQAEINERQRQERAELVRDLTPIANEAFRLGVEQLEEVQEYIDISDLLRLSKRLMRNGRNLETMLDQLESLMDFMQTVGPLMDAVFMKSVDAFSELEQKGYFTFGRGSARLADKVVAAIDEEDLNRMGDNIVLILEIVQDMTRPEILNFVRGTMLAAEQEFETPADSSLGGLFRQMRDPAFRRGLALTLRFLRVIGEQAQAGKPLELQ